MAWGDGYEATTGPEHVNQDYMQRVVDYTDDVVNSQYGYLEDFGDIFLPENKNSKESIFAVQTSQYTEDNTIHRGQHQLWPCQLVHHAERCVGHLELRMGLPQTLAEPGQCLQDGERLADVRPLQRQD